MDPAQIANQLRQPPYALRTSLCIGQIIHEAGWVRIPEITRRTEISYARSGPALDPPVVSPFIQAVAILFIATHVGVVLAECEQSLVRELVAIFVGLANLFQATCRL